MHRLCARSLGQQKKIRMIYALEIIGKFLSFAFEKMLEKEIDLSYKNKSISCRSFTKLYFCLSELDEITDSLLKSLESRDLGLVVSSLNKNKGRLEAVTQNYFDVAWELEFVIEIFDDSLSKALFPIYYNKASFLINFPKTFVIDNDGKTRHNLIYLEFEKELSEEVLKKDYEKLTKVDFDNKDTSWANDLYTISLEEDFNKSAIDLSKKENLDFLHQKLSQHSQCIKEARLKLRDFLKKNFTIDEVLYTQNQLS